MLTDQQEPKGPEGAAWIWPAKNNEPLSSALWFTENGIWRHLREHRSCRCGAWNRQVRWPNGPPTSERQLGRQEDCKAIVARRAVWTPNFGGLWAPKIEHNVYANNKLNSYICTRMPSPALGFASIHCPHSRSLFGQPRRRTIRPFSQWISVPVNKGKAWNTRRVSSRNFRARKARQRWDRDEDVMMATSCKPNGHTLQHDGYWRVTFS